MRATSTIGASIRRLSFWADQQKQPMLFPWQIPEIQGADEAPVEFAEERAAVAPDFDAEDEIGWGSLMETTLRDANTPLAA